jgi:hypothetical protein
MDTVNVSTHCKYCTLHGTHTLSLSLFLPHTYTRTHTHHILCTIGLRSNELAVRYSSQELGSCQALYNKLLALDPSAFFKEIHTIVVSAPQYVHVIIIMYAECCLYGSTLIPYISYHIISVQHILYITLYAKI